ncbi:MAG: helix-turn-helix transcriptional regulator [Bacteroidales bacterium]|nr:helix-turn-helix transcriptional regulator [Bacteroidales bacterium]
MKQQCPASCPLIKHNDEGFYIEHHYTGDTFAIEKSELNHIIFVEKGSITVNSVEKENLKVDEHHFIFCYKEFTYEITANSETKILISYFTKTGATCDLGTLFKLYKNSYKNIEYDFKALPFTEALESWMQLANKFINDDISCAYMHSSLHESMFVVFRFYYSPKELLQMLYNLFSKEFSFRTLIENNRPKAKNLNHLAELCGYDIHTFNIIFRKYYSNITPYNWMQEERSKEIYKDLCETDLSINSIAEKFNFSGTGHLSEFCKRFLGNTPLKIRKEYRIKKAERRKQ